MTVDPVELAAALIRRPSVMPSVLQDGAGARQPFGQPVETLDDGFHCAANAAGDFAILIGYRWCFR